MRAAGQAANRRQERRGSRHTLGQAVGSAALAGTSAGKGWGTIGIWKPSAAEAAELVNEPLAMAGVCKIGKEGTDQCRNVKDTGAS